MNNIKQLTAASIVVGLIGVSVLGWLAYSQNSSNDKIVEQLDSLQENTKDLAEKPSFVDKKVDPDKYQAVFLDNGQVYFGKLTDSSLAGQVELTDIYYLQTEEYSQSSGSSSDDISLAKLGNELHGPEDAMYISFDKVLFWENMKNSSEVVQAILAD